MTWEKKYTFLLYMQNNFTISIFDILETSKFYASYMNFNFWDKDG